MASKAKPATPEGQPCEKCGVVECGTAYPGVLRVLHAYLSAPLAAASGRGPGMRAARPGKSR